MVLVPARRGGEEGSQDRVPSLSDQFACQPSAWWERESGVEYCAVPVCVQVFGGFPVFLRAHRVARPEKEHHVQLRAFSELLKVHPEHRDARLVLIGGSRNEGDAKRAEDLRALAKELGIEEQTTFLVNAPYPDMLTWLGRASLGLSTMVDEHFGINVVEFMVCPIIRLFLPTLTNVAQAAGVIPIAHASGGPLKDIIVPYEGDITGKLMSTIRWGRFDADRCDSEILGYHATDPASFASAMHEAFCLADDPAQAEAIRRRARDSAVMKFSDEGFVRTWESALGTDGWDRWVS
jgi:alpha-1,2-mannosyltransferase